MAATQEERTVNANVPSGSDGTHPAKSVLKEAVDAVLNSFAKHTHGYGRGKLKVIQTFLIINKQRHGSRLRRRLTLYCLTFIIVFPEITLNDVAIVFKLVVIPGVENQILNILWV